jgi:hypothetical protein
MNERIRELAEQAGIYKLDIGDETAYWVLEKFAELIVRECLDVMSKKAKEAEERFTYMGDDVPTTVHQSNISKHFGVEE